jgi:PAS domain S-box-containing protein
MGWLTRSHRGLSLFAAMLAIGLFATYLGVRHAVRGWLEHRGWSMLSPEASPVELTAVVAVLATGGAVLAVRIGSRSSKLLHAVHARLRTIRRMSIAGRASAAEESSGLLQELDELARSYANAIAELRMARADLDDAKLRTPLPAVPPASTVPAGDSSIRTRMAASYTVASARHRMIARLAPNLQWMAATPPLLTLLGRGISDLTARTFIEVVHPEDKVALEHALKYALKDGEAHNVVFRVTVLAQSKNGDRAAAGERHLQADVMSYYTADGTPLQLRCHFIDITDRIKTENELRQRTEELSQVNARLLQINQELQRLKESYRDLYHQAPMLYFSIDGHGRMVACNQTMVAALGCPREQLLNQAYIRLLTPQAQTAFLADPKVFQRQGELETQWAKQDGTVIDVSIATTTIRDENGGFIRSRSAARDITEQKRLANALKAKAVEVAQANAHLRRVNQELEDFTYVVSHDLKEPLRTLEAFSNFLAHDYGDVLGDEGHDYIKHLIQASRRLGTLIDDLLTLSRSGRVIHTPRPFSWDEILQTVLADLQDLIARQHATVRVEGALPQAVGDPERVIQLLSNLISNGLKYNKGPQPEVVVGSVARPPSPPPAAMPVMGERPSGAVPSVAVVTLFVRDNGIGIDPMYHEQIFRMFRRLHRRDEVEGTGAGLAICKRIVEAHGGRIWLESQAGLGATFYFTLPRSVSPVLTGGHSSREREAVANP